MDIRIHMTCMSQASSICLKCHTCSDIALVQRCWQVFMSNKVIKGPIQWPVGVTINSAILLLWGAWNQSFMQMIMGHTHSWIEWISTVICWLFLTFLLLVINTTMLGIYHPEAHVKCFSDFNRMLSVIITNVTVRGYKCRNDPSLQVRIVQQIWGNLKWPRGTLVVSGCIWRLKWRIEGYNTHRDKEPQAERFHWTSITKHEYKTEYH